jgi:nitroreductase
MSEPYDLEITDHLLSTTRAVRMRLDFERPVSEAIILDCLRVATQAPTGSNRQNWRWMVVTEPGLKDAVADAYRDGAGSYLEDRRAEATGPQERRIFESAVYLAENMQRAPALVIPCIEHPIDLSSNGSAASTYGSILPAVWSFQLALRARDLGSAWTTLHLKYEDRVAKLLGIPDGVHQVALLPVAYTKGTDFKPARRQPVEEVTHWNRWGVA